MKQNLFVLLLIFLGHYAIAQKVRVPAVLEFADIELRINDKAREEIQNDVDALTRSEKYFNIKLDRVLQYFPIIEGILREEHVPDDFKYLVIQESALIPDAVSTSNAVGFWQFKESSGEEVGLRIDRYIDERMNIISATKGACKYLKTNNLFYDNWLYALVAYNTGRGGAESYVDKRYFGSKRMEINKHTHWYVKKFLAHKIAFEYGLNQGLIPSRYLYEYRDGGGKSLSEIAADLNLDPDELLVYNKWVRRGKIPTDKIYTVIIPSSERPAGMVVQREVEKPETVTVVDYPEDRELNTSKYPVIKNLDNDNSRILSVNGIPGTLAKKGDNIESLAALGDVQLKDFLKYNDIDISHRIIPGQVYYFHKKRNKAREHYHVALPGESSWSVSQKYGIREKKLLRKNRIKKDFTEFEKGRVVWMRFIRPKDHPVEYAELPQVALNRSGTDTMAEEVINAPVQEEGIFGDSPEAEQVPDREQADGYIDTHLNETEKQTENVWIAEPSDNQVETDMPVQSSPLFHIVEPGETLYGISRQYGISLELLRNINDLPLDSPLQIGQKVYLKNPFPEELSSDFSKNKNLNDANSYIIHQVKRGETLYAISRRFNVTVEEIREWNHKSDNSISEGELLKIKR